MSLLEAVTEARRARDEAERRFRRALRLAAEVHSLRKIGEAAGMSFNGIRYLLLRPLPTNEKERKP